MQIIDLANNKIEIKNCLGCEIVNNDIEIWGGYYIIVNIL